MSHMSWTGLFFAAAITVVSPEKEAIEIGSSRPYSSISEQKTVFEGRVAGHPRTLPEGRAATVNKGRRFQARTSSGGLSRSDAFCSNYLLSSLPPGILPSSKSTEMMGKQIDGKHGPSSAASGQVVSVEGKGIGSAAHTGAPDEKRSYFSFDISGSGCGESLSIRCSALLAFIGEAKKLNEPPTPRFKELKILKDEPVELRILHMFPQVQVIEEKLYPSDGEKLYKPDDLPSDCSSILPAGSEKSTAVSPVCRGMETAVPVLVMVQRHSVNPDEKFQGRDILPSTAPQWIAQAQDFFVCLSLYERTQPWRR